MSDKQQIKTTQPHPRHSKLDRFSIDFEYDKTLRQVKRDMHIRTI